MKTFRRFTILAQLATLIALILLNSFANAQSSQGRPPKGPGKVVVHPKFGGTILGFDVDQNGSEGLLSEFNTVGNNCPWATETFDQVTGKILKVVSQGKGINCDSAEVASGVVGTSIGLVEYEHSAGIGDPLHITFKTINPVDKNQINGSWTPPFDKNAYIGEVGRNQGTAINAFQVYDVKTELTYIFGSDVGKNTFGPVMQIPYPIYA